MYLRIIHKINGTTIQKKVPMVETIIVCGK